MPNLPNPLFRLLAAITAGTGAFLRTWESPPSYDAVLQFAPSTTAAAVLDAIRSASEGHEPERSSGEPPDGVCIARATDAMFVEQEAIDTPCKYHGVGPGQRCPSQSEVRVDEKWVEKSGQEVEPEPGPEPEPGQVRATRDAPATPAVQVNVHLGHGMWSVVNIAGPSSPEVHYSADDIRKFWPISPPFLVVEPEVEPDSLGQRQEQPAISQST